jgi:hypothetical protein
LIANQLHYFASLPKFHTQFALGIEESVVPWELMRTKKQGRVIERPHYGKLVFLLFKK